MMATIGLLGTFSSKAFLTSSAASKLSKVSMRMQFFSPKHEEHNLLQLVFLSS